MRIEQILSPLWSVGSVCRFCIQTHDGRQDLRNEKNDEPGAEGGFGRSIGC